MCVARFFSPFPFPQRGKHGSQDKGAAFRPLQALHATTQKQIFCIIRGIVSPAAGVVSRQSRPRITSYVKPC